MHRLPGPTRRQSLAAAAIAAVLALSACGGQTPASSAGTTTEITIAEQSKAGVTTGLLPHLADELGYFKEQGLTVKEYIQVTKGSDAISGMISGAVQFSHIGADGITVASQGAGVVGIGATTDASIWTVVASKDISDWNQLKGKTIALGSTSDITKVVFDELAEQAGLHPATDLKYVALGATPQRVAAVQNGQASATLAAYPAASRAIAGGLTDLGLAPKGHTPPSLMTTDIEASKAWASAHPEQTTGYLGALKKAADYIKDPAHKADVAARASKLSGEDSKDVQDALDRYFINPPSKEAFFPADFRHAPGAFDATVSAYQQLGLLKTAITEDKYMDYTFADKAVGK